jgi:hypothetical protein
LAYTAPSAPPNGLVPVLLLPRAIPSRRFWDPWGSNLVGPVGRQPHLEQGTGCLKQTANRNRERLVFVFPNAAAASSASFVESHTFPTRKAPSKQTPPPVVRFLDRIPSSPSPPFLLRRVRAELLRGRNAKSPRRAITPAVAVEDPAYTPKWGVDIRCRQRVAAERSRCPGEYRLCSRMAIAPPPQKKYRLSVARCLLLDYDRWSQYPAKLSPLLEFLSERLAHMQTSAWYLPSGTSRNSPHRRVLCPIQ